MSAPADEELVLPDIGCFGCSPSRPDGLGIRFRRRGERVVSDYAIPASFHGAPGVAHGGIVATLLDEMSCAAAAVQFGWFVVTGELTVRYERAIPLETSLHLEAWVASSDHPRYVVVEATVDRDGERLARATSKIFRRDAPPNAP